MMPDLTIDDLHAAQEKARRRTILATPAPGCPGCEMKRLHSGEEMASYHPDAGHGFQTGQGWSKEGLVKNGN